MSVGKDTWEMQKNGSSMRETSDYGLAKKLKTADDGLRGLAEKYGFAERESLSITRVEPSHVQIKNESLDIKDEPMDEKPMESTMMNDGPMDLPKRVKTEKMADLGFHVGEPFSIKTEVHEPVPQYSAESRKTNEFPVKPDVKTDGVGPSSVPQASPGIVVKPIPEPSFVCFVCSELFMNLERLKEHITCHMGVLQEAPQMLNPQVLTPSDKRFRCRMCTSCFSNKDSLAVHRITHSDEHLYKCEICLECFRYKRDFVTHTTLHSEQMKHKCEFCTESFRYKRELVVHKRVHEDKSHKCEICARLFKEEKTLANHMKLHGGSKPKKCDVCSRYFRTTKSYNAHLGSEGVCENLSTCEKCEKSFADADELKLHMESVHGYEKHQCTVCMQEFSQKCDLTSHLICVHGTGSQHPWPNKSGTTSHVETVDGDIQCDLCPQKLKDKIALVSHKICAHSHDSTYTCHFCSHSFKEKKFLWSHIRLHMTMSCAHCSEVFSEQCYLDAHLSKVHGIQIKVDGSGARDEHAGNQSADDANGRG